MEMHHRLSQLDAVGWLPPSVKRFLVDESVPGASVTLVPELSAGDFVKLLETPTKESIRYWVRRGERSVWPAVAALKVRCAVESELDRGYQFVRRRKAGGLRRKSSALDATVGGVQQVGEKEKDSRKKGERGRAASAGADAWKMAKDGDK